jgi:hypothetical protein
MWKRLRRSELNAVSQSVEIIEGGRPTEVLAFYGLFAVS